MVVSLVDGPFTWSGDRDEMSHREFKVTHKVQADRYDGPFAVMNCPGLPLPGQAWNFDNDVDELAWCKWDRKVTPVVVGEANELWLVESTFSTRPVDQCREDELLDPLEEPSKLSISVSKYQEEALFGIDPEDEDERRAIKITNSAHEVIRGPQNEWDASRANVKVTGNFADAEANLLIKNLDTVNDEEMWGFDRRCIKYSTFSLERKYHGSCDVYYTRTLEFDIRPDGFDRHILDEGTKVLNGEWNQTTHAWDDIDIDGFPPNPLNPNHFIRFQDVQGNNIKGILDGEGRPWVPNLDATLYWWCVNPGNGFDAFVENNTCGGVTETAFYFQAKVQGAFDTQEEAELACEDIDDEAEQDPAFLVCPEDPSQPGRIFVKKYKPANFFGLFVDLPDTLE